MNSALTHSLKLDFTISTKVLCCHFAVNTAAITKALIAGWSVLAEGQTCEVQLVTTTFSFSSSKGDDTLLRDK